MPTLLAQYELPILEKIPAQQNVTCLDGRDGHNRAPLTECSLSADNDWEAIKCWLNEYNHKPSTYRVYQKEAERILLWCLYQQQKPLSNVTREDMDHYLQFLANPQPTALWCGNKGGRGRKRGEKGWKPFAGSLNSKSQETALTILNSLFSYLVDAGYWRTNPLKLMRRRKALFSQSLEEKSLAVQARILETDEWTAMLETLHAMSENTPHEKDEKIRLQFIVAMLYFLGLRIGELTSHSWSAFREIEGRWWFIVKGKGDKIGKIPVNDNLLEQIIRFRTHLRLPALPQPDEEIPLVPAWRHGQGLQARYINTLLKRLAIKTAECFQDKPHKAKKLQRFSAHWLRHLSATMQHQMGIPFHHIRANHRHEKDETTKLYVHTFDTERHAALQKFKWKQS